MAETEERKYAGPLHEFGGWKSPEAQQQYSMRFHSRDYSRVFLEGQNPHLNPDCTTIVHGTPVYDPATLRRLAHDLHHGPFPFANHSRIPMAHRELVEFFEYATGRGSHQSGGGYTEDRFFNPHIYLPSSDFYDWSLPHMVGLVEEVYSFVGDKMQRAGFKIPSADEHIVPRAPFMVEERHAFAHRGEQPELEIDF